MPVPLRPPPSRSCQAFAAAGLVLGLVAGAGPTAPRAQTLAPPATAAPLPADIAGALGRAQIEPGALAALIVPLGPTPAAPRLAFQADRLVHPASLMKLVSSAVALERLGPGYTWTTPVYLDGPVHNGVLGGSLVLEGRGDPRLVTERAWLLLRRVQQLGVREIRGDIVLDRSAFQVPEVDPGAFDGEPHKPYNVRPDALMVNQKAALLTLRPQPERGVARVGVEPPLAGLQWPAEVPLAAGSCRDWRQDLGADFSESGRWRFSGRYASACGERVWPVAPADPARFNARAIEGLWRELGGRLQGRVREGVRPAGLAPVFEFASPTLAEVLRDMNKHSNNVITHQVVLTLALQPGGAPATFEAARELMRQTVEERIGCSADELRLDNGSGLSRDERITASCLGRVLQWSWSRPWMPELLASLPIAGEATARRALSAAGRAHLKTGSLNGVAALAGVVDAPSGRRHAVVAILNHPRAGTDEARAALDSVVRWALEEKDLAP